MKVCQIAGCENKHASHGWCDMHYKRWWRHGDPSVGCKVPPKERFMRQVEQTQDGCWQWTGYLIRGYGAMHYQGRRQYAHRISLKLAGVSVPDSAEVDHRCHNTRCVNPDHLRVVTRKQNVENKRGPRRDNKSSGKRGVYRNGKRWGVKVGHLGKQIYIGTYDTVEEADRVAKEARSRILTHDDYEQFVSSRQGQEK